MKANISKVEWLLDVRFFSKLVALGLGLAD